MSGMRDGVVAVVFDATKENYLLVKRRDVPVWVLPGGGIDDGETPEVSAVREVLEESGFEVEIVRQVAVYTPTGRLTSETHSFECAVIGGAPSISDESMDVKFFPVDTYPPPVFDVHRNWMIDALRNEPEIIRKPVEGLDWKGIVKILVRHPVIAIRYLLSRIGIRWNSN